MIEEFGQFRIDIVAANPAFQVLSLVFDIFDIYRYIVVPFEFSSAQELEVIRDQCA